MPQPYDAILFDLLTALLDSWTLWNTVAGDAQRGARWRNFYLQRTYATGPYRPYEVIVAEAASQAGYPETWASQLVNQWDDLQPWPEVLSTLDVLRNYFRLGVVTNCSEALAYRAVRKAGSFDVVVSAERVGFYKPDSRTYQLAFDELGSSPARTLFVAGSPFDLIGSANAGMPAFWHNHIGMAAPEGTPPPAGESREFRDLLDFCFA